MSFIQGNLYWRYSSPAGFTEWEYHTTDRLKAVYAANYFAEATAPVLSGLLNPDDILTTYVWENAGPNNNFSGLLAYSRGIIYASGGNVYIVQNELGGAYIPQPGNVYYQRPGYTYVVGVKDPDKPKLKLIEGPRPDELPLRELDEALAREAV